MSLNTFKPAAYQQNNDAYHNLHKQIENRSNKRLKKRIFYGRGHSLSPRG